jgi:hypothetical protein
MTAEQKTTGDKLAFAARMLILTGIGVLAILIATVPSGTANPLRVGNAQADGGIASAPGYLALTTLEGNNSRFYLINSDRKTICVYTLNGGMLRLVSVRKFDEDSKIFDASVPVTLASGAQMKAFEGTDGLDRTQAKAYAEGLKKMWDSAHSTKPK